jgi:hypothetical protein
MLRLCSFLLAAAVIPGPAASRPDALNARAFFEVLHPSHDRGAAWPARLTFDVNRRVTLAQFKLLLRETRWRTAYQCDGRPAPANAELYDGINNGYLDIIYDEDTSSTRQVDPIKTKWWWWIFAGDTNAAYTVTQAGAGKFVISFPDGPYASQTRLVARVRETQELVLISETPNSNICADGGSVRTIQVPIDPAAF